jgi:hypothetical protein
MNVMHIKARHDAESEMYGNKKRDTIHYESYAAVVSPPKRYTVANIANDGQYRDVGHVFVAETNKTPVKSQPQDRKQQSGKNNSGSRYQQNGNNFHGRVFSSRKTPSVCSERSVRSTTSRSGQNQTPQGACYKCKEHGHWKRDCPVTKSGPRKEFFDGECFHCSKYGHRKINCRTWLQSKRQTKQPQVICDVCEQVGHDYNSCWKLRQMVKEGKVKSSQQDQRQAIATTSMPIPIANKYNVLQDRNGQIYYNNLDQSLQQQSGQQLEGAVGGIPQGTVFFNGSRANQSALNR